MMLNLDELVDIEMLLSYLFDCSLTKIPDFLHFLFKNVNLWTRKHCLSICPSALLGSP